MKKGKFNKEKFKKELEFLNNMNKEKKKFSKN